MEQHLAKTAVIRKAQPTNFAQKARISNSMRKDANYKAYEYQKRTETLINMSIQPSKLNVYDPKKENNYDDYADKPVSPNRIIYEQRLAKIRSKTKRKKRSNQPNQSTENATNQNVDLNTQNRPKPRYSLFKRNDE